LLIALTGASGFVGKSIAPKLREIGQVVAIRALEEKANYRLNQPSNIGIINPDVLIHCAMTRNPFKHIDEDENFLGAKRIVNEAGGNPSLKIIYISSLSSHSKSLSKYGQSKFKIEEYLSESSNVFILRAGLICAEQTGGFESVLRKIANTPFILISILKIKLYLTPIDTLLETIAAIVQNSSNQDLKKVIVADSHPIFLTDYLNNHRSRSKLITIEVSLMTLLKFISFIERRFCFNLALFDSVKSYATPIEQRNYNWDRR
jgi:dTDP-4-dehydrorhamnose reductase